MCSCLDTLYHLHVPCTGKDVGEVFSIKTKVQTFGDILDTTVESIRVTGENVEITQTFTHLESVVHSSTSCELEVNRRLGRVDVGVDGRR